MDNSIRENVHNYIKKSNYDEACKVLESSSEYSYYQFLNDGLISLTNKALVFHCAVENGYIKK